MLNAISDPPASFVDIKNGDFAMALSQHMGDSALEKAPLNQ